MSCWRQSVALSLRGRTDAAGFVAAFSGSHRFVLDYLTDEVLDGQPGPVRAFLLETSVLERLSGELCDAVTGRPGSQAMLCQIERAGLFLVPLDEVRGRLGPAGPRSAGRKYFYLRTLVRASLAGADWLRGQLG